MKAQILKTEKIKQTRYELIKEENKNKFWITKVSKNNIVTFIQPFFDLEKATKYFDKTIASLI